MSFYPRRSRRGFKNVGSTYKPGGRYPRRGIVYIRNRPRRRYGASAKASRALMLIRKLRNEEEKKYIYDADDGIEIPIGGNWIDGTFGPFCIQGDARNERIGNKITVQSIAIRWMITLQGVESCPVRLIFVIDRRPAGANTTSDMLMYTDNQIKASYTQDELYKGRFNVIYDKTHMFNTTQIYKYGKIFYDKPFKVLYNGNAETVADLRSNSVSCFAMSHQNAAAITVGFSYKFSFTDN